MKSKLKIISWNVNGIRAVHKKGFIGFIKKEKPDILCLQEIKAVQSQFPDELFDLGYKVLVNSADKKGYSGVSTFIKNESYIVNMEFGNKRFDSEGRFIELTLGDFSLVNFYIPQGGRDKINVPYKLEIYEKLFSYIKKIKNKNIILIGDFNIAHQELDLARPKQNKNNTMFTQEERRQIDKLLELGFIDSFRQLNKNGESYTWWPYFADARNRNLGWRIDYAFISKAFSKHLKNAYILKEVRGSDHAPIVLEIN
ncbi:exodeoxyribonuclease III [bacterium]|nr:exodeoxyribonuclease III [bacterium]